MILYFVRHGQTDFNKTHRLQGIAIDEPLNEIGVGEVNESLPNLPKDFEVIYSSPLKRVLMSSEIISQYSHKPVVISDKISERDFGSLAGKTWDEIPNGRDLQDIDRQQKYDYHEFGGESVEDVKKRLNAFFKEVKNSAHSSVLVVSSIGIIRLVYKLLNNEDVIEIKNASVHKFTM